MTAALQTAPSSGMPAILRKPPSLDDIENLLDEPKPDGGRAAGIIFVAPDGDVLLLRRSSTEPNYGGHWALPGGKADDGETPEQCAHREAGEELGGIMGATIGGDVAPLRKISERTTPTGMTFHTFARPVAEKFCAETERRAHRILLGPSRHAAGAAASRCPRHFDWDR